MDELHNPQTHLDLLSTLLFEPEQARKPGPFGVQADYFKADYSENDFQQLWELATTHHVIMRTFPPLLRVLAEGGDLARWLAGAIAAESQRIENAFKFLGPICESLESVGDVVVIKSLDHWPDLGNDLDLYTNAASKDVLVVMRDRFNARLAERSWGDRLANKWNFIVPGLGELVEVHVGRLGQTGEQVALTGSLTSRSGDAYFGAYKFRVPAAEVVAASWLARCRECIVTFTFACATSRTMGAWRSRECSTTTTWSGWPGLPACGTA